MDGESLFEQQTLENPEAAVLRPEKRAGVRLAAGRHDQVRGRRVKQIRLGRRPEHTTRVVLDTEGVENFSVFTLYNPYRIIIDLKGPSGTCCGDHRHGRRRRPGQLSGRSSKRNQRSSRTSCAPPLATVPPIPTAPSVNLNGQFSLARQLGLGISRIVIDAGHGGHDPGARANGLNEAELVLDVASRLRKLLEKQPTIEVTMTRDTDVFIPLEQRTAIANREGADLFLSIHANASRNTKARGVETYFLNFASNPEAENLAARENSSSGRTMHSLPEIVRAIALNNKIDESRDFASTVQRSMVRKLVTQDSTDSGSRRQAGAVRRVDRRGNAERAGRDFIPDEQARRAAAQDAGLPAADCGSAPGRHPQVSRLPEEDEDSGSPGVTRIASASGIGSRL